MKPWLIILGVIILFSIVLMTSTTDLLFGVVHSDSLFMIGFFSGIFTNTWLVVFFLVGAFLLIYGKSSSQDK